jgi:hypothetical protein
VCLKHGVFRNSTSGSDKAVVSKNDAVVQRRTVPNQAPVADIPGVTDNAMPYRDVIADLGIGVGMQNRIVLDVGSGPDFNLAGVGANYHPGPHA